MRQLKYFLVLGFATVAFSDAAAATDPASDFNHLVNDYRAAEQKLPRDPELFRGAEGSEVYNPKGALSAIELRRHITQDTLSRLDKISPADMRPQDKLSYQIFHWSLEDDQRGLEPDIAELPDLLPLNQFDGRQIEFPREIAWRADNPWKRPREYDDAIRRMLNFSRWADGAIARMREGLKRGIVQSRAIVNRVIGQVDMFAVADPDSSDFMQPIKSMAPEISGTEHARIESAYHSAVADELLPAYRRLSIFLKTEYLPHAPEQPGLSAVPGGKELYRYLVTSETTSDLSPDAIHDLGMKELARIEGEMETAKEDAGFHGSLAEFRQYLHSDPKFRFKDPAAMLAEFTRVKNTVTAHLPDLFVAGPKIPLAFRFYDSFAAPDKPAAEYTPGSADGRRAGTVYLNDWDLPERPTYTSEVLELHEGIPGHHLQVSLALENTALPRFRRFGGETAFVEGWALYAETLGPQLGLYTDPYQKFGALSFDAWRASRLVVDTGIHWLGWSREQAVIFLTDHTALSRTEAEEEVDRYTVLPGQALAYKMGELEILDLRSRAKLALGPGFDLKRFHDALLRDGAMPLPVLDQKMSRWIQLEKDS